MTRVYEHRVSANGIPYQVAAPGQIDRGDTSCFMCGTSRYTYHMKPRRKGLSPYLCDDCAPEYVPLVRCNVCDYLITQGLHEYQETDDGGLERICLPCIYLLHSISGYHMRMVCVGMGHHAGPDHDTDRCNTYQSFGFCVRGMTM